MSAKARATLVANTYIPGIVAAIERGDQSGAAQLYRMALEDLRHARLGQVEASRVLFWSMTGMATAMLRRAAAAEDKEVSDIVASLAQRQHEIAAREG